jgi:hypothetical protein
VRILKAANSEGLTSFDSLNSATERRVHRSSYTSPPHPPHLQSKHCTELAHLQRERGRSSIRPDSVIRTHSRSPRVTRDNVRLTELDLTTSIPVESTRRSTRLTRPPSRPVGYEIERALVRFPWSLDSLLQYSYSATCPRSRVAKKGYNPA